MTDIIINFAALSDVGLTRSINEDAFQLTDLSTGKSFDVRSYFGLLAPAGTPKPITAKLQAAVARIVDEPEFRRRHLIERGLEPVASTPDAFASFIKKDRVVAGQIVKEAGLEPQ